MGNLSSNEHCIRCGEPHGGDQCPYSRPTDALSEVVELLDQGKDFATIRNMRNSIVEALALISELRPTPPPPVQLVKGTCSICGKEFDGHPGDNACRPCWLYGPNFRTEPRASQPPAAREKWGVMRICAAYESGFGHGAAGDGLPNPYAKGSSEFEAYQIGVDAGYAEGKRGASQPPPADELRELRATALQALHSPVDQNTPEHERDLVVPARLLVSLIDSLTSLRSNLNGAIEREKRQASTCKWALDSLQTLRDSAPPPSVLRESAWFVEALHAKPPRWAADITLSGTTWTHDANCALRFSRREDAEKLAAHVTHFEGRWIIAPTEHTWCGPPEDLSWYEGNVDSKVVADIVRLKQAGKL